MEMERRVKDAEWVREVWAPMGVLYSEVCSNDTYCKSKLRAQDPHEMQTVHVAKDRMSVIVLF